MPVPSWNDFLELVRPAAKLLDRSWLKHDTQIQAEFRRQLATNISIGYMLYFQADPDYPDWTPLFNQVHTFQPNPDDTYYWSPLKAGGIYRLYGYRGRVHKMMFSISCGMIGMSDPPGPLLSNHDINDFEVRDDGWFEIILSGQRPVGHKGNFVQLDPRAEYVLVRQRHYDWANEFGTQLGIEALHPVGPKPRMDKDEIDRRMEQLAQYVSRLSKVGFDYHDKLARISDINVPFIEDFSDLGGLGNKQIYWQVMWKVKEGEGLYIETELPKKVEYWNVQLNTMLFDSIDYLYRQSHLNGFQAKLSPDGKFRAIIANEDPGVHNWLDASGHHEGVAIGRWTDASNATLPVGKIVRLSDIAEVFGPNEPRVTAEERAAILRERVRGHQFRRRW